MVGQGGAGARVRFACGLTVILALFLVPAPLLPPHRIAQAIEHGLGLGWESAYFVAAVCIQAAFYFSVGVLAALAAGQAKTGRGRFLQAGLLPLVVVGVAVIIRSLKAAHFPYWVNAVLPAAACLCGVSLGLSLLYRHLKTMGVVTLLILAGSLWMMRYGTSSSLHNETEIRLRRLALACPAFPAADSRFVASLQNAFAPEAREARMQSAVDENRAAILAWGIAFGHPRLASFVGFSSNNELVLNAARACQGATLDGREDWPRHYAVSAAISVLENPLVSDAGGVMKEQLDSLSEGSGFSFGDLTADRAGVRFAAAATASETAARAMQQRMQNGISSDDFFPPAANFPENLTVEQFRAKFGGVGTRRYYEMTRNIESLLDRCVALSSNESIEK